MPAKGVTKTGDAFCMSCGSSVDVSSSQCPSCLSELESEVRAFVCPRCGSVLELGTQQCGKCGMRFKVKALKPPEDAKDEKLLSKLIEWGKPKKAAEPEPAEPEALTDEPEPVTDDGRELEAVSPRSRVVGAAEVMLRSREELLERMNARLDEARIRLATSSGLDELPTAELLQAELEALALDVQDLRALDGVISGFARAVASLGTDPAVSEMLSGTDIVESAARMADSGGMGRPESSSDEKEEQLRKREEMVDRKIKAYAAKKKQLESLEAQLTAKAGGSISDGPTMPDHETEKKLEEHDELCRSVSTLLSDVLGERTEASADELPELVREAGTRISELRKEKESKEAEIAELNSANDDVRKLLKALDALLGELPKGVIDRFSATEEFALYEKVFDRLKI